MGCLIQIKLTEEGSKKNPIAVLFDYRFFTDCKIISEKEESRKKIYEVYVRYSENRVSRFLVKYYARDKRVEKTILIS